MSRIATTVSSEYTWAAGSSPATMRQKRQSDDMERSQVIPDGAVCGHVDLATPEPSVPEVRAGVRPTAGGRPGGRPVGRPGSEEVDHRRRTAQLRLDDTRHACRS